MLLLSSEAPDSVLCCRVPFEAILRKLFYLLSAPTEQSRIEKVVDLALI